MNVLFLFLIVACSTVKTKIDEITLKPWVGVPLINLETHPYFSTLTPKTETEGETIRKSYLERSPFESKARCEALGGCQGMSITHCRNVFESKKGVIIRAWREGTCRNHNELLPSLKLSL